MSKIKCPFQKPKWEPLFWDNLREQDLKITNCYNYAFNVVEENTNPNNDHKIQPGEISNTNKNNLTCKNIIYNVEQDYNVSLRKVSLKESLPCNHYRIAIVIDNIGDHTDYHFYRQDSNGYWSHKDGWRKATNKDKHGKLIREPEIIEYENKSKLCTYFIFPIKKK